MTFTQRLFLTRKVRKWCEKKGLPIIIFNVVSALDEMGFINVEKVEKRDKLIETMKGMLIKSK